MIMIDESDYIAFFSKVRGPFYQEKLDSVRVAAYLDIPHFSEKRYKRFIVPLVIKKTFCV